jgi:hypothetical protein
VRRVSAEEEREKRVEEKWRKKAKKENGVKKMKQRKRAR